MRERPSRTPPARFDKLEDAASYNAHAQSYARHIRSLSAPLAAHICALAELKTGDHVLDVGTGTGVAARQAAKIVGTRGTVLGVDLSEGMIDVAQKSIALDSEPNLQFRVMDAEQLELPETTFDAVISLCAVRHFPDIARALAEMRRVLKPSGRIVVSFGFPRPITPLALVRHALQRLSRTVISPARPHICGPDFLIRLARRLLPTVTHNPETDWGSINPRRALVRSVRDAGFEKVECSWWGHDVAFQSGEEFWDAQAAIVTEIRKQIANAPADAVLRLKKSFIDEAERVLRAGGTLTYPYGAFFVAGEAP